MFVSMRPSLIGYLAIACALASCSGVPYPKDTLGAEVLTWIASGELVGAEILIVRDGETYMHEAYGWKDRESGAPMEINSVYSLASLTKPLTALAVLIAVEEGWIELDDPIAEHIPTFRGDARARVRDLLAHSSGDGGKHGAGAYNVYEFQTLEAWVLDWAGTESSAKQGEFAYSNFNYAALGYIVEKTTGIPFADFVTDRVLEPLGMSESHIAFSPDADWVGRVPTSYVWDVESARYEVFWTSSEPQRWDFFPAAFGLWGTARDYAKFVLMWNELSLSDGSHLVSETLLREALRPQSFRDGEAVYGFGWFVDAQRTKEGLPLSFRHSGGDGTLAIGFPADKGVVVYLTQSEVPPNHLGAFRNRIEMSGLFSFPGTDLAWIQGTNLRESPLAAQVRSEYIGRYSGSVPWFEEGEWEAVVKEADGVLKISKGAAGSQVQDHFDLVPLSDDQFTYGRYAEGTVVAVDPPVRIRFRREQGVVVGLDEIIDGQLAFALER